MRESFSESNVENVALTYLEVDCWQVGCSFYRRGIHEIWCRGTLTIARLMQERGLEPPIVSVRDGALVNSVDLPTGKATSIMPTLRDIGPWIGPRWPERINVGPLLSTMVRRCRR